MLTLFSRPAKVIFYADIPITPLYGASFTSWYDLVMQEGKNIEGIYIIQIDRITIKQLF